MTERQKRDFSQAHIVCCSK